MDLRNAAYSKEYLSYRDKQYAKFRPEFYKEEKHITLSDQYTLIKKYYKVQHITLSENDLVDQNNKIKYSYKNIYDGGDICKLINHTDGNIYFLFRCDIYGYSILNLSTMEDFHYYPECTLQQEESFIWTDAFYNQVNNILAVEGCFWACPYSILLVDFSIPMESHNKQTILFEMIDPLYEKYGNIVFAGWNHTDLYLNSYFEEDHKEQIIIDQNQYSEWL